MGEIPAPASLSETAREAIKNSIIAGHFQRGAIYSEQAVAAELGISKTPVHNALVELESKGFVAILARRGFMVNETTREEMAALFEYRRSLETGVVRNLTLNLNREMLDRLQEVHDRFEKAVVLKDFVRLDRLFHETMAELTNNKFFIAALADIWDLVQWLGANNLKMNLLSETTHSGHNQVDSPRREHEEILEAIAQKDTNRAVEALNQHLDRVMQRYLETWDASQDN